MAPRPEDALAPLLAALGVAVEKHEHGGANYNVVHNSAIYVLDPNAEWIAVSTGAARSEDDCRRLPEDTPAATQDGIAPGA